MNENEVYKINGIINNFFSNIKFGENENKNSLSEIWEETIKKIYKYGPKLSGHTKIVDLRNGILLIESDHPGWNQILQNNKNFILKGLKLAIKDIDIKTLAFRVKGNDVNLHESYEEFEKKTKENFSEQLDKSEKKLEEMGFNNKSENKEVPEEIKKFFTGILDS